MVTGVKPVNGREFAHMSRGRIRVWVVRVGIRK
jgi:hypothetical protein